MHINQRADLPPLRVGSVGLFFRPSMRPFTEGCHYLHEHYALSRVRRSLATRRNAAYALVAWLDFLSARRMDWRDATRADLRAYRDGHEAAVSPHTGRGYAPGTIAQRMLAVASFYAYAAEQGWYDGNLAVSDGLPDARDANVGAAVPIDADPLAHLRTGRRSTPQAAVRDLIPPGRPRSTIRPFLVAEWRAFVAALGPLPSQREQGDFRPSRDRLVAEVGRTVGLRVEEVVRLTRRHFDAIVPDPRAPFLHYPIVVAGKGGMLLPVAVPAWLVGEIHAYIKGERRRAITRLPRGNADPEALFVHGEGSRTPGRPLSVRRLQQVVEESCLVAGLREVSIRRSHDGKGTREVVRARHSFHDLRHTYAVWTYWAERQAGNSEPWLRIQRQLRHRHLETTRSIYLSYVDIFDGTERPVDLRAATGT